MSAEITSSDPGPAAGRDAAPRLRSDGWRSREAILDAAHAALSRDRRTTMHEIADAAGVGRSTIYRYFPTRTDLERALSRRSQESAVGSASVNETRPDDQPVGGRSATTALGRTAGTDPAQFDGVRPAGQLGREGPV